MRLNAAAGKRLVCAALSAAVTLSSFGPQAASAAAQEMAASRAAVRMPAAPVVLPVSAAMPSLLGARIPSLGSAASAPSLAAPAVAPSVVPAALPSAVRAAVPIAAAPAAALPAAPASAATAALGRLEERVARPLLDPKTDAAAHLERVFDSAQSAGAPAPALGESVPAGRAAPLAPAAQRVVTVRQDEPLPPRSERENRSASFPLTMAAASGLGWLAVKAVEYGITALTSHIAVAEPASATVALGVAAAGMLVLGGTFLLNAAVDAAAFGLAMWRGRKVSDEDFRAFVRAEVASGRMDANAATLLKPYRPQSRLPDFTFAFAAHGSIWMRPELISTPVLFRTMLVHELHHWKAASTRGPPARGVRGLLSAFWSELRARGAEFKGTGALKDLKVSDLERALRQAQVSLKRSDAYKILVVNPDSKELEDPGLYAGLSGGSAQVTAVRAAQPLSALEGAQDQGYQAVVLGNAASLLPPVRSQEAMRLERALKQPDFVKLDGVGAYEIVERLYSGLSDRGMVFMSFAPEDRGVATWARILGAWKAADGGQFRLTRVDLAGGGHIFVLRKFEARVGLWLRPVRGGRIQVSVPRASDSEEGRQAALSSLREAGFSDQLALFEKLDMRVRHVFGADVGRQELYVTVPRSNAAAIRKFVSADSAEVASSDASFTTHLVESGELMGVPPVWKVGVTGEGGKIMWVDTGADASHEDFAGRLDVIDMVNEGPEDWVGHGTHVAGISLSSRAPYLGMAKGATGTMAKVFSRDQSGASDGEIMGSAAIALQKGYDVVSLSLGSRGASADNLAEFFSQLTHQKNSAGEYPIVTASAGNSGPFDQTLSQPSAGADVISVAAAAKSLDDGRPEISFYSSVGPDIDRRFAVKRLRLKPEVTGIGGDVTTKPGSTNVYEYGVYSAKSKDAAASASDLEDGRHTGMSGTSMSNPAVAGIALLVKMAMKAAGTVTPFVAENLPFAVKAVLMRSSRDMGAPIWFQGAGLVDAWAAVKLVTAAAGCELGSRIRRIFSAQPGPVEGWGWLERLKAVVDSEDKVFREAELAKSQAQARFEEGPAPGEDSEVPPEDRSAMGNAIQAETVKRFNEAREREIPALLQALHDPVWLVRQRAAFALLNFRAPSSAMALAEVALGDGDARVRQVAFLALAEIQTHSVDLLLQTATRDPRWDVGIYAAYALARRGDRGGMSRLIAEFSSPDKSARFSATWLSGQLGVQATVAEAEALSARLSDTKERGNIRHLSAAALANLADSAPESISDRVVTDLLASAGPVNLALTRTLAKFFPVAVRERSFVVRLRSEPLKPIVTDFVLRNRDALQKPGALAELVQLLARAAAIPLDAPTASLDPLGNGVRGVDPSQGDVDLLITPVTGRLSSAYADESDLLSLSRAFAGAGIDAATLARFEASPRAAMPLSGSLWVSVPEHKLYALSLELQRRGYGVKPAVPGFPLSSAPSEDGEGFILNLDHETGRLPEIPETADLSLVKVRAASGVSEALVMASLEKVAARIQGRQAAVISLSLATASRHRTALSALVDKLVLSGLGIVVGAGNEGPALGTVNSPGDSKLAVVVAAASREKGLQFYSSRGTIESPRITWTDLVADLDLAGAIAAAASASAQFLAGKPQPARQDSPALGTAAAAESTAGKLAVLARMMQAAYSAQMRPLPVGWFAYLQALVIPALTPMPDHGRYEVGSGLFEDVGKAKAALELRLKDLDALQRDCASLAEWSRNIVASVSSSSLKRARPGLLRRILRGALAFSLGSLPAARSAKALVDRAAPSSLAAGLASRSDAWWKDASATRTAVTVPLYALRRDKDDPGVGKFTDLGRYYRDVLAQQGVDSVLLLPHFAVLDDSPYAPVSLYALDEDNVDWSEVGEVRRSPALLARLRAKSLKDRQSVDYNGVRARSASVAAEAFTVFAREELAAGTERGRDYGAFLAENSGWLDEYAEFVSLSKLIGKPVLDWTEADQARARKDPAFAGMLDAHRFAQWNAYRQLRSALAEVHAAGGRVLFDVPMFRAKNGVDAWKRPEAFADLRTRNPGIKNAWIDEDWKDLALWRWSKIKQDGYRMALDPYRHWMGFGFDGARVDALHFAYLFGNGQKASGDEPGDDYVSALSRVFQANSAFPLAEAFEGKDADARRFGFVTVGGDWKKVSSHDDPRSPDFLGRYFRARSEPSSGASAKFVAWTLGDEWRDPFPVKESRNGRSFWNYRIPLPSDPDYASRARFDARAQLRVRKAVQDGDAWRDPEAVRAVLAEAADGFIKHDNGSVQIWAASMDWFLEEWGRDTFISLPGLLLSTRRFDEAKENIRRFSKFEHDGLIPNRIWDAGRWTPRKPDGADYNTADGPMWFIQAVKKTIEATGDMAFAAEMAPVLRRIIARWQTGTGYQRYGRFNAIKMDSDGLVSTPAQATWMDADPDGKDRPVTPRDGKTVEINALWYANLRFLARLEAKLGSPDAAKPYDALADKVKASFNDKFWFVTEDNRRAWGGDGGALRDVIEGDPHGSAVRPNMIFAVSHGSDLLSFERQEAVVRAVTQDLLTPYGLRTLSPRDGGYRERYDTSQPPAVKDQAYHQGTVWPWLMGAYVDAFARVRRAQGWDAARVTAEVRALMTPLITHLVSRPEGSLPEVFDGGRPSDSPMAQNPGGTRSQAWSVGEVLRLLSEHGLVAAGYSGLP